MRLRVRIALFGLALVGALAAAVLTAGYWLLATEAGARFALARLDAFVPGTLSIGELDGRLLGPLVARNVVYETDTSRVTIDRLALAWNAGRLAQRRIDVEDLGIEGVRIESRGAADEQPFELPDLRLPLRLNLAIHRARIANIEFVPGAEPAAPGQDGDAARPVTPLTIDAIELATRTVGDRLQIERFVLRAPELQAEASGWLAPQGDYPLDVRVVWDAGEKGAGEGRASGSLEKLQVTHELGRPLRATLRGSLERPLRDLTFDLALSAPAFDLPALLSRFDVAIDSSWEPIRVGGEVDVRGSVAAFDVEARLAGETGVSGPVAFEGTARRDGERWTVARAALRQTAGAAPVVLRVRGAFVVPKDGQGEEQGDDSPRLTDVVADAEWTNLRWPLFGGATPALRSPAGTARVEGEVDAYKLAAEAELAGLRWSSTQLPSTRIFLTGEGNRRGLERVNAQAVLLGGQVEAHGSVEWDPMVRWQANLVGDGLDPALVDARFPGRLAVRAGSSGRIEGERVVATIAPLAVEGVLRDQSFTAAVAAADGVEIAGDRVALHELNLAWGSASASVDGAVAPEWDLAAELRVPELGLVLPEATGSVETEARLTGPTKTPRIVAEVRMNELVWDDLRAAQVALDADLDLAPAGQIVLHARGDALGTESLAIERATVEVDGRREAHRLRIEARTQAVAERDSSLRLAANGGLDSAWNWRGTLEELTATTTAAGNWSLAGPAVVRVSAETAELETTCLQGSAVAGGRVCASGRWQGGTGVASGGWSVAADLERLPLSLADSFLAPGVAVTGTVDGSLSLAANQSGPLVGEGRWSIGPGELTYPVATQTGARPARGGAGAGKGTLRFARGEFSARSDVRGLSANGELPLPDLGSLKANVLLPEFFSAASAARSSAGSQPLEARLAVDLTDLGFVQAFSPEISETRGRLAARLEVAGTLGAPRVSGELTLSEGRARVPELGLHLTAIELHAAPRGADRETLELSGSVRSGEGTLTLAGEAPVVPSTTRPIRLTASGQHFETMATREVQLTTAPDVELTFDGERVRLGGRVRIEKGEVDIRKRPPNVAKISEDVVFVGERAPRADLPFDVDVRVNLGDDLEIAVLGLEAKPRGSLRIVEVEGKPTSATGEIRVDDGTFQAYGQDLEIERGRMVFAGPIERPRIDLRASRKANDGTVAGLDVEGTLVEPRITLWSEPAMGSSDQLSYLLLGRPLSEATSTGGFGAETGDADVVANAARSLGLKGGDLLARQLAARFGLEEARVETESVGGLEQASLVVGKYLSPRLYVAYGVGLFGAANTIRLRYELGRRYTLQATQGLETGADILYTLERGRSRGRRRAERDRDRDGTPDALDAGEPRVVPPS